MAHRYDDLTTDEYTPEELHNIRKYWGDFVRKYPHANLDDFHLDEDKLYDGSGRVVYNVMYNSGGGKNNDQWIWGDGPTKRHPRTYLSDTIRTALGEFPRQLTLSPKVRYSIPCLDYTHPEIPNIDVLTNMNIYVSPNDYFPVKFPNVFKETVLEYPGQTLYDWKSEPNLKYWPQQLNFAVWCATSGCGVCIQERELKTYPPIVQGLLKFHVYFTIRRILYELGAPLPNDDAFQQTNNMYDKTAYERLCNEFNVSNKPDFRFKGRPGGDPPPKRTRRNQYSHTSPQPKDLA